MLLGVMGRTGMETRLPFTLPSPVHFSSPLCPLHSPLAFLTSFLCSSSPLSYMPCPSCRAVCTFKFLSSLSHFCIHAWIRLSVSPLKCTGFSLSLFLWIPSILHPVCKMNFFMLPSCLRTPMLWGSYLNSSQLAPAYLLNLISSPPLYSMYFIWLIFSRPLRLSWAGPFQAPSASNLAFSGASFCFSYETEHLEGTHYVFCLGHSVAESSPPHYQFQAQWQVKWGSGTRLGVMNSSTCEIDVSFWVTEGLL